MNMFPIFVTLLFCGFLFIYFNTRLAQLKNAVEKQNRVLTSFITNIQSDIRGGGNGCGSSGRDNASCDYEEDEGEIKNIVISENNLASDEAVNAVRRLEREKIVVSDDSESEDSDSDSEDSDSEDSDDEKEVLDDIKVIKLQDNSEEVLVAVTEPLVELINIESNFSVDALLDAAAAASAADADATPSYEQMKVDDLRKVVADKGLAPKEEVKKLKKPELLVLLKK